MTIRINRDTLTTRSAYEVHHTLQGHMRFVQGACAVSCEGSMAVDCGAGLVDVNFKATNAQGWIYDSDGIIMSVDYVAQDEE
jgi:hypothetical protein